MAEVSKEPDPGENNLVVGSATGPTRSSTVSALPADPSNAPNFSPTPLRSSQSTPTGGVPDQQDARKRPALATTNLDAHAESSPIDPLSQHILKRTNTQKSIPPKLLGRASYEAEARGHDYRYSQNEQGPIQGDGVTRPRSFRDKKKGVSFLSRFIGGKKKDQLSDAEDDASEPDVGRMDAAAQPIGFIPRFPRPPKYLRVRAHYKKEKTFDKVFVAQELDGRDEPTDTAENPSSNSSAAGQSDRSDGRALWAMVFSNDGRYLAAAGQDKKVRVWAVISSPEDRDSEGDSTQGDEPPPLKAPVFKAKPVQVYEGHSGSILDLSWSKNNFLLSSSMDKTVRLWHVTRPECLCCFQHGDFVTSIQFHPRDDRFFLAGSLDTKLRLWSIPDKSMAFVTIVPDMITSVSFTPDGRYSIAGCLNGICSIHETDGLKPAGHIYVRSARGRNAKGSKITGIDAMVMPPGSAHGETKLLITSNDSRIRLYNFRDRALEAKFRGNENTCSQIRATFSDDGKHVICGSEDRRAYIWPIGAAAEKDTDKRAVEVFETHSAMVTAAAMAPAKTKQILDFSEDPIYDICNPPPVALGQGNSTGTSTPRQNEEGAGPPRRTNPEIMKLALESPTYVSRSTHPDGNIIIVADYSGKIKVLRQDCAYQKRRYDWDAGGSAISRKLLGRSNSARRSIASSIGKESSHKTPSERIISWRNSVIGHDFGLKGYSSRNASPVASRPSSISRASMRAGTAGAAGSGAHPDSARPSLVVSPPLSSAKSSVESARSGTVPRDTNFDPDPATTIPHQPAPALVATGKDKDNPLWLKGDHSYAFWSKVTHDALAAHHARNSSNLSPNRGSQSRDRNLSLGSALSSDYASTGNSEGDGEGKSEGKSEADDEVLKCENCRGTNFQGTKGRNGKQRLVCVGCRRPVS